MEGDTFRFRALEREQQHLPLITAAVYVISFLFVLAIIMATECSAKLSATYAPAAVLGGVFGGNPASPAKRAPGVL